MIKPTHSPHINLHLHTYLHTFTVIKWMILQSEGAEWEVFVFLTPLVIVIRIHFSLQSAQGCQWYPVPPYYHSLIDWKSCLCTILLANRDQYSGAGSSIREKDQHEYVFEPAWWNRKQYIDRFWGKVKPSIKRKDHALNGPGKHLLRATRRRKILRVFGSYQQQHMDSHTTVTL